MSVPTIDQRKALFIEWVNRLGLTRWHISFEPNAVPQEMELQDVAAETVYKTVIRDAVIRMLRPEAFADEAEYCFEQTLVHELLHLVFAPFYPSDEGGALENAIHMTIEDLSVALVKAKYGKQ